MFAKVLVAGWGDMDFNAHMRNTAYLDKSADVRMMYFSEKRLSDDRVCAPETWPRSHERGAGVLQRGRVARAAARDIEQCRSVRGWEPLPREKRIFPLRRNTGGQGHQCGGMARPLYPEGCGAPRGSAEGP